jgi:Transposase DDE domain
MSTDSLSNQVLVLYCFVDDFLQKVRPLPDRQRKFTDAQVITTALIAARRFGGNYVAALGFLSDYEGFYPLDPGVFSMRLKRLRPVIHLIFNHLAHTIKSLNLSGQYIVDTFPVAVCHNIRAGSSALLQGKCYWGYCKSKRGFYYGFKVQVITTAQGIPVQFDVFCAQTGEITAFQCSQISLPENSELYGDKAYNDYRQEDLLAECERIALLPIRKARSKRADQPHQAFLKAHIRQKIENAFSQLTHLFPKRIHATDVEGFLLKLFLFVLAFMTM